MSRTSLEQLLSLTSPPVAVAFVDAAPAGVPHVSVVEAASCGYWRRAAAGEVFYTVADDHKRCPLGAHTHNVTLSPEEKQELMGMVQTMVGLSYLKMEEVPQIPTRKTPLRVAVYAPLSRAPVAPDVVLVRGNARQLMLLAEASQSAGVAGSGPTMGRPTCAVLPEAHVRQLWLHRQPRLHRRRRRRGLLRHPWRAGRFCGEAPGRHRSRQPGIGEVSPSPVGALMRRQAQ
jgi:uncharacterized protein (DUF169 family)